MIKNQTILFILLLFCSCVGNNKSIDTLILQSSEVKSIVVEGQDKDSQDSVIQYLVIELRNISKYPISIDGVLSAAGHQMIDITKEETNEKVGISDGLSTDFFVIPPDTFSTFVVLSPLYNQSDTLTKYICHFNGELNGKKGSFEMDVLNKKVMFKAHK